MTAPAIERVLVTGAGGFVGRWVCQDLARRGLWVSALDRVEAEGPWDQFHCCDLAGDTSLDSALADIDTVVHLAGLAHSDLPGEQAAAAYHEANVHATERLVDGVRARGVRRLVMMSSVKAISEGEHGPIHDDTPPAPTSEYGRSKRAAELIVLAAGRRAALHVAIIRSALVYGPGVKGNLRAMCDAVAAGRFPPLAETGNRRSLVDVRDVATALWLAAVRPEANGRAYIVTDGESYSTRRILDAIRLALGRDRPPIAIGPRALAPLAWAGDVMRRITCRAVPYDRRRHAKLFGSADFRCDGIVRDLGFRRRYTLEDVAGDLCRP
jgi:nucleoside-diphosphate-sugar epimerase